jgi:hypothetical protein
LYGQAHPTKTIHPCNFSTPWRNCKDELTAVEIKRSSAPATSKGFHLGAEDIGATHKWVVYGGSETYPLGGGIQAVPLDHLQAGLRGVG